MEFALEPAEGALALDGPREPSSGALVADPLGEVGHVLVPDIGRQRIEIDQVHGLEVATHPVRGVEVIGIRRQGMHPQPPRLGGQEIAHAGAVMAAEVVGRPALPGPRGTAVARVGRRSGCRCRTPCGGGCSAAARCAGPRRAGRTRPALAVVRPALSPSFDPVLPLAVVTVVAVLACVVALAWLHTLITHDSIVVSVALVGLTAWTVRF